MSPQFCVYLFCVTCTKYLSVLGFSSNPAQRDMMRFFLYVFGGWLSLWVFWERDYFADTKQLHALGIKKG
jgi:hypothetical protein